MYHVRANGLAQLKIAKEGNSPPKDVIIPTLCRRFNKQPETFGWAIMPFFPWHLTQLSLAKFKYQSVW
jgi:hypothetical protein